jgi:hypothetical protein
MDGPLLALVLLTLVGGVVTLRPSEVARFEERIDAEWSSRENYLASVEPTARNVFVFRVTGIAAAPVGLTFLLRALFGSPGR